MSGEWTPNDGLPFEDESVEPIETRLREAKDRIAILENALRRCIPLLPGEWQSEVSRLLTETT